MWCTPRYKTINMGRYTSIRALMGYFKADTRREGVEELAMILLP